MFNPMGFRSSLLNQKIRSISRSHFADPNMGVPQKKKINFEYLCPIIEDHHSDTKKIKVIYILDVNVHESQHDSVMMKHLGSICNDIGKDIDSVRVFFKHHTNKKNLFNKIYNLIRLNFPVVQIDVLPEHNSSIYTYFKNECDSEYYYLSFHPYIEDQDMLDLMFEYTFVNKDVYRYLFTEYPDVTLWGIFVKPSMNEFWYDYVWFSGKDQVMKAKSIFKFDDMIFSSVDQIESNIYCRKS